MRDAPQVTKQFSSVYYMVAKLRMKGLTFQQVATKLELSTSRVQAIANRLLWEYERVGEQAIDIARTYHWWDATENKRRKKRIYGSANTNTRAS